ncbi:unnamed protein product [Ceutorhynchus assimilis]|uniref:Uncharacterized protein n=1 Tax=Ceutorhynchus assimilis TaxID=467358 RepID=A0A9N9QPK8_9CUCU|nr:unnamed protein product [Ceutorhynchus assimilis]
MANFERSGTDAYADLDNQKISEEGHGNENDVVLSNESLIEKPPDGTVVDLMENAQENADMEVKNNTKENDIFFSEASINENESGEKPCFKRRTKLKSFLARILKRRRIKW